MSSTDSNPSSSDDEGSRASHQSHGRQRARDGSPVASSDEDRPTKRRPIVLSAKRKTTDQYGIVARQITRTINMNWEPFMVINAGVELLALDDPHAIEAHVDAASEEKQPLYELFLFLCERIVGLKDTDMDDWADVQRRLEDGKTAAKTEDNRTFKTAIPNWRKWDPPLKPNSKDDRGLAHPEQRRRFLNDFDPPASADEDWCAFMYLNCVGDVDHMAKGLLRSDLMVRAVRTILFPASVANAEDKPDFRSNRRSKAATYQMTKVTPGLLAYAAVCIRYALSSETTFNNNGGIFNYETFYDSLLAHLNDPECEEDNNELMEWWNK
ncbi:hypothetical protein FRC06_007556 [Ceratobasidium sp. 370]|nr:hypothetical protein FRC06_007556 [Ceratobasidium sp. 370]